MNRAINKPAQYLLEASTISCKWEICLTILMLQVIVALGQKSDSKVCYEKIDSLTKQKVFSTVDNMPTMEGGTEELSKKVAKACWIWVTVIATTSFG